MLGKLLILLVIVGFLALVNGKEHLQTARSVVPGEDETCASRSQADLIQNAIAVVAEEVANIKLTLDNKCTVSPRSCSAGWSEYSSSCYMIIDRPTQNFQGARKACQDLGGDLVKISSSAENAFISQLATKTPKERSMWIGLFRGAGNAFHWVDGSPLSDSYSNWNKGEPNNGGGIENCVELFLIGQALRRWNDIPCANRENTVIACEKQK